MKTRHWESVCKPFVDVSDLGGTSLEIYRYMQLPLALSFSFQICRLCFHFFFFRFNNFIIEWTSDVLQLLHMRCFWQDQPLHSEKRFWVCTASCDDNNQIQVNNYVIIFWNLVKTLQYGTREVSPSNKPQSNLKEERKILRLEVPESGFGMPSHKPEKF